MRLLQDECGIESLDALRRRHGRRLGLGDARFPTAIAARCRRPARSARTAWSSVPARWAPWRPSPAGTSRSLVERAADVTLKERRKLILVPRETPLSLVHLRNLVAVTEAGAVVIPAAPGFYHRPTTGRRAGGLHRAAGPRSARARHRDRAPLDRRRSGAHLASACEHVMNACPRSPLPLPRRLARVALILGVLEAARLRRRRFPVAGQPGGAGDGRLPRRDPRPISGAVPGLLSGRLERRPRGLRAWLRFGRRAARDARRRRRGSADRADRERPGVRVRHHQLPGERARGGSGGRRRGPAGRGDPRALYARPVPRRRCRRVGGRSGRRPDCRAARRPVRRGARGVRARSATSRARSTTSAISACCSTTSSRA